MAGKKPCGTHDNFKSNHDIGKPLKFCIENKTPVAGLIFETKKSRDFSGENFLERNYCPRTSHVMFSGKNLVIQTGKLQPVLTWREKPVLLALLSNLGIPVPASYPVFRTKWREIS